METKKGVFARVIRSLVEGLSMLKVIIGLLLSLFLFASTVSADSPFVGKSGNFSTATCPSANNPHCPPQGK